MPWYRFEKFCKGETHNDYLFLKPKKGKKKVTREQIQEEMFWWGKVTPGGHNCGSHVYAKYVKRVPLKVLKKRVQTYEKFLKSLEPKLEDYVQKVAEAIEFLKKEIRKQKRRKK